MNSDQTIQHTESQAGAAGCTCYAPSVPTRSGAWHGAADRPVEHVSGESGACVCSTDASAAVNRGGRRGSTEFRTWAAAPLVGVK
jgi:hypothetical protein